MSFIVPNPPDPAWILHPPAFCSCASSITTLWNWTYFSSKPYYKAWPVFYNLNQIIILGLLAFARKLSQPLPLSLLLNYKNSHLIPLRLNLLRVCWCLTLITELNLKLQRFWNTVSFIFNASRAEQGWCTPIRIYLHHPALSTSRIFLDIIHFLHQMISFYCFLNRNWRHRYLTIFGFRCHMLPFLSIHETLAFLFLSHVILFLFPKRRKKLSR